MLEYNFQLKDIRTGKAIMEGGKFQVVTAGTPTRVAIYDSSDVAASNPKSISSGAISFRTAESVSSVDIYGFTTSGVPFIVKGVEAGGQPCQDILIDPHQAYGTLVIPFDIDDTEITANSEFDTGFDLATNQLVLPHGMGVKVDTADSGMTVDVGILSSESGGDADGFIDGVSLTSAVFVRAVITITTGSNTKFAAANPTLGALVADHQAGTDVDQDEGMFHQKPFRCDGTAKSISLTLSASTDTGSGYAIIPIFRPNLG